MPDRAQALPVFAHRYGLTCQACHTTVPHLSAFGERFARNGFRLPKLQRHEVFPVAVKVNLAYSSDASGGLPKAVVDEIELLSGGAIGTRVNYFLEQYVVDGGMPGRSRDMWVQYNFGEGNAHVRAGQFTLPLPVDPETQRDTQTHYLLYDQTVGGNTFDFFDPRMGVEVYIGDPTDGNGLHLAALTHGDLMGYAAHTFGALTLYAYRYQGRRAMGGANDAFYREGGGAGQRVGKFDVLAVLQHGHDGIADSSGGFAEAHYTFSPALMTVARYDRIWDALSGAKQQTIFSLVTRPARNMRFTIEDQITTHHTLNLGWLFAY